MKNLGITEKIYMKTIKSYQSHKEIYGNSTKDQNCLLVASDKSLTPIRSNNWLLGKRVQASS